MSKGSPWEGGPGIGHTEEWVGQYSLFTPPNSQNNENTLIKLCIYIHIYAFIFVPYLKM